MGLFLTFSSICTKGLSDSLLISKPAANVSVVIEAFLKEMLKI